jgi:hypothetical protein
VYPDARVVDLVTRLFVPVRVHVKREADQFRELGAKYSAHWTPTILILDTNGEERHRIEGFLPADDFLAQLTLGLGHAAFAEGDFARAEPRFREVLDRYPNTDAAPEAQYWAGVSKYKASGDGAALAETARAFKTRYTDTAWAKKSTVWEK